MTSTHTSDILIVGGGLAGLSLAILCADHGFSTVVIEKQTYPRHKVCGEYLSTESLPFLQRIGIDLTTRALPKINHFVLTSSKTKAQCSLAEGGIGLSRFTLDHLLYEKAKQSGVLVYTENRVTDVIKQQNAYRVSTHKGATFITQQVIGGFGRISGLMNHGTTGDEKYVGIKYHVEGGPQKDTIEIHTFEGGYCGVSAIEEDKFCMCYLVKADKLKTFRGDINTLETQILSQNPYLKNRLKAKKIIGPISTAHFNFGTVPTQDLEYPMLGDAAGFIPPITGNGMSLALRSSQKLFSNFIDQNKGSFQDKWLQANKIYINNYLKHRIDKGIFLQNILLAESPILHSTLMWCIKSIPGMMPLLTQQAVGKPF